jgi:hypothetical protein
MVSLVKHEVEEHEEWTPKFHSKDLLYLLQRIRSTHIARQSGNPEQDKERIRAVWANLRMYHNETSFAFRTRVENYQLERVAVGLAELPTNELVIGVLNRLDMTRYGELVQDYMSNERRNIKALPDNIAVLWKDIKETQVIRFRGLAHPPRMESVYLATAVELSARDRSSRSGRGRGGRFKPSPGYSPRPSPTADTSPVADINCWTCGVKGHRSNVCPQKLNVKPIHFTETTTVPLFLSTLNTFRPDDDSSFPDSWTKPVYNLTNKSLLTSTLLLDTQSSIHLICNPALLTEIQPSLSPISVRGITRDQIYVPDEGIIYQIGVKAYFSPHTAANILSYSQLQTTHDCTYDRASDTFTATPHLMGPTLTFSNIGGHYSLEIHKVTSVFVASIASTSYTKKQLARARMRMGYVSYKSAAEMLQRSSMSDIGFSRADLVTAHLRHSRRIPARPRH